jgi:hypothetical protein
MSQFNYPPSSLPNSNPEPLWQHLDLEEYNAKVQAVGNCDFKNPVKAVPFAVYLDLKENEFRGDGLEKNTEL